MAIELYKAQYRMACERAFEHVRRVIAPNPKTRGITSTGNLAFNALKYEWIGDDFHMWVDEEVAPYMVFTNEKWISERWHGKQNPNEGWWNYACEYFIEELHKIMKGELKHENESSVLVAMPENKGDTI